MNILKQVWYFLTRSAVETYETTVQTQLKKSSGKFSGVFLPEGFTVEADWKWDKGNLIGYRLIVSGTYQGYYVNDDDIVLFQDTPPVEDVAYVILYETDGTTRKFEEI